MAAKNDGRSGCGIAITAVDREEKCITSSKSALPLKACTFLAVEIAGTSVLTEVIDLLFDNKFNWRNVNECINSILRDNRSRYDTGLSGCERKMEKQL